MDWGKVVDEELEVARLGALTFTVPCRPLNEVLNSHKGFAVAGSRGADEESEFDPTALANATMYAGVWLTDACAQFFDVLDGILSSDGARRVGMRPTVRAVIEHAAMAAWLMDPRIGASQRAARGLLCEAVSADSLGQSMKYAHAEAVAASQERIQRVDERIGQFFEGGIQKAAKAPNQHSSWTLGGEEYGGLTGHMEDLVARRRSQGGTPSKRGRTGSMFLASITHPSAAGALMHGTRDEDGIMTLPVQDLPTLTGFMVSALAAWSWAVDDLLVHHGWACPEFRAWEARLPPMARSTAEPNVSPTS